MNNFFSSGSRLGDAFNDIFKTESRETKTDKRVVAITPMNALTSDQKTSADVAKPAK